MWLSPNSCIFKISKGQSLPFQPLRQLAATRESRYSSLPCPLTVLETPTAEVSERGAHNQIQLRIEQSHARDRLYDC